MDKVVNLKLLGHPLNWLVVWTVLLFAAMAWTMLHSAPSALSQSETT